MIIISQDDVVYYDYHLDFVCLAMLANRMTPLNATYVISNRLSHVAKLTLLAIMLFPNT